MEEKNGTNIGWGILGFFFPLVGLILFLVWKKDKKSASKASGIGALVGFLSAIIIPVLLVVIIIPLFSNYSKNEDPKPDVPVVDYDNIISVSAINVNNKFKDNLYSSSLETKISEGEKYENDIQPLKLSINNGKLTITGVDSQTKEINNVKKVYYKELDCTEYEGTVIDFLIIETSTKTYYVNTHNWDLKYGLDVNKLVFKELSRYYKYYKTVVNHAYTCGGSAIAIGDETDDNDMKIANYDLNGETIFRDEGYYYYDSSDVYINRDRTYKIGDATGTIKLVIKDNKTDELEAFIDENQKAYTYNTTSYDQGMHIRKLELLNENTVKSVKFKDDKVIFIFSNDEEHTFNDVKYDY